MLATDPHRPPADRSAARVFRGESATVELGIQGLRGRRRWIEIHATPLPGDDGDVSALVCVGRDITARRGEEAALRDREARWRGVFGSPMIGILFWDSAGAVTDANDAFLQLIGYSREDLGAGRVSWLEMTPLDERHLDERALDGLVARGFCEPYKKHFIRKDGSRVPHRDRCGAGRRLAPAQGSPTCRTSPRAARPRPAARERGALPQHGRACAPDSVGGDEQGAAPTSTRTGRVQRPEPPSRPWAGFFAVLHPDDGRRERAFRATVANHGRYGSNEYRVRRRDGATAT